MLRADRRGPRSRAWHIGRRHVEDGNGEPVVVDWRAPVAVPFYRATFHDTLGLRRRRRFILDGRELVDLIEEDFEHPDSSALAAAGGLPDPLLAELGRARTGTMRDIVATIAGEQDRIIRAPLDVPIVVQGGPGTGKTAVGLHRAAFLLYEHRVQLEREGVLVLGPNRLFLSYISEVLPSLGEVAVVQTTLAGLVPEWQVRAEDPPELAALKGDARMAEVLAKACRLQVATPTEVLAANTRWGTVRLGTSELAELVESALSSGGAVGRQRARFQAIGCENRRRDSVGPSCGGRRHRGRDEGPECRSRAATGTRQDLAGPFGDRRGSCRSRQGRRSARWRRSGSSTRTSAPCCGGDGRPGRRRAGAKPTFRCSTRRRRCSRIRRGATATSSSTRHRTYRRWRCGWSRVATSPGRSFTVLGDLAQATAPGSQERWEDAFDALGMPQGVRVEELTTGYRVPQQIMELANALLAATRPTLVRPDLSGGPTTIPSFARSLAQALVAEVAEEAAQLHSRHQTVAVVAVEETAEAVFARLRQDGVPCARPGQSALAGEVSLLRPPEAKGLEFDAVIVVEPADFVALRGGTGLLYIALTRAVAHLSVDLHEGPHPGTATRSLGTRRLGTRRSGGSGVRSRIARGVAGSCHTVRKLLVCDRCFDGRVHRDHPCPDRHAHVLFVVLRTTGPDLRRRFSDRQADHAGRSQL